LGAGYNPAGIVFLPDGSKAYVNTNTTNAVKVINASTKTVSTTLSLAGPGQIAMSPDGTAAIVAVQTGTPALVKINTTSDTTSTFSSGTLSCPTGVAFTSATHLYVSDQCHGPDVMYSFASFPSTTSTNFAGSTSWVANRISASPDGTRVIGPPGGGGGTLVIQTSNNSILQTVTGPTLGDATFFSDNKRLIAYNGTAWKVYDYTGTTLSLLDTLSYSDVSGAFVGITADQTLYIPNGTSTVTVHQYY